MNLTVEDKSTKFLHSVVNFLFFLFFLFFRKSRAECAVSYTTLRHEKLPFYTHVEKNTYYSIDVRGIRSFQITRLLNIRSIWTTRSKFELLDHFEIIDHFKLFDNFGLSDHSSGSSIYRVKDLIRLEFVESSF